MTTLSKLYLLEIQFKIPMDVSGEEGSLKKKKTPKYT